MRSNAVEWATLVISVLAISGVAGFLVVDGLTDAGAPAQPTIRLHPDRAYDTSLGWVVPATLANEGDQPAEQVVLEAVATAGDGGGEPETSEIVVDFLPAGTEVEVAFAFSAEPPGEVRVRLVGFLAP